MIHNIFDSLFGMMLAFAALLLTLYVLYDIIFVQDMSVVEKLIWVIIVLVLNLLGVLLYLVLVKYLGKDPLKGIGR